MNRMVVMAILLVSAVATYGLDSIPPRQVIKLEISNPYPEVTEYCLQPFFLSFDPNQPKTLQAVVVSYEYNTTPVPVYSLFYNTDTGETHQEKYIKPPDRNTSLPLYSVSPVKLEWGWPVLEGFFIDPNYPYPGHPNIPGPYDFAVLSSEGNFLGTNFGVEEIGSSYIRYAVRLWSKDAQDGQFKQSFIRVGYGQTFEIAFSPSGKYFYFRGNKFPFFSFPKYPIMSIVRPSTPAWSA